MHWHRRQMYRIPVAQDLLKRKSFCKATDTVNKTKRQAAEWERIEWPFNQGYFPVHGRT